MTEATSPRYATENMCLGAVPAMRGTEDWRRVAAIISDVSETLYYAGWLIHAEYDVYRLMTEGGRWGVGGASDVAEQLGALRSLSKKYGVWAHWCHEHGKEPMDLPQWKDVYAQWRAEWCTHTRGPDPHRYDDGHDAPEGALCVWCLWPKEAA